MAGVPSLDRPAVADLTDSRAASEEFRALMASFPTGVAIITASDRRGSTTG